MGVHGCRPAMLRCATGHWDLQPCQYTREGDTSCTVLGVPCTRSAGESGNRILVRHAASGGGMLCPMLPLMHPLKAGSHIRLISLQFLSVAPRRKYAVVAAVVTACTLTAI